MSQALEIVNISNRKVYSCWKGGVVCFNSYKTDFVTLDWLRCKLSKARITSYVSRDNFTPLWFGFLSYPVTVIPDTSSWGSCEEKMS